MRALLFVLILCCVPGNANASCAQELPRVIVTIPSDGETGVPLDSRIWVAVGESGVLESVTLGETTLTDVRREELPGLFSVAPGPLQADTDYQFTAEACVDGGYECQTVGPVHFSAGGGAAMAPERPVLHKLKTTYYETWSHAHPVSERDSCFWIIRGQNCIDSSGWDYHFITSEPTPAASYYSVQLVQDDFQGQKYFVDGHCPLQAFAPTFCPGREGHDDCSFADGKCFTVIAFNHAGQASGPAVVCGGGSDGGCSVAPGGRASGPMILLTLLAGILGLVRRGYRPAKLRFPFRKEAIQ